MTISDKIPSVLQDARGSISMERALKQIRELLLEVEGQDDPVVLDQVNASIDDVDTMLKHIERGG